MRKTPKTDSETLNILVDVPNGMRGIAIFSRPLSLAVILTRQQYRSAGASLSKLHIEQERLKSIFVLRMSVQN
jgi:hypothetical protein